MGIPCTFFSFNSRSSYWDLSHTRNALLTINQWILETLFHFLCAIHTTKADFSILYSFYIYLNIKCLYFSRWIDTDIDNVTFMQEHCFSENLSGNCSQNLNSQNSCHKNSTQCEFKNLMNSKLKIKFNVGY